MAGRYGWWTEASCKSDCRRFRAQEDLEFGGKERGWQEGSVLPLTCAGDAPWRMESVREEVAAVRQTIFFFSLKKWRRPRPSFPSRYWIESCASCANNNFFLYVLGDAVLPRRWASWSRTREEEAPTIGSHGVHIFTHKDEQYANC